MNEVNLAKNPAQRTPCILILDHSASMDAVGDNKRQRIAELNDGIAAFVESLKQDSLALSRVQIAIVSCGGESAGLMLDWTDAIDFEPFELTANGGTPLGEAVVIALDAVKTHKATLREYGIPYTRPWIIILTDGEPTDEDDVWNNACQLANEAESKGSVEIFPIGVGGADMRKVSAISKRPPLKLEGMRFRELFVWLSSSLGQVTRSTPNTNIDLPTPGSWASVKL